MKYIPLISLLVGLIAGAFSVALAASGAHEAFFRAYLFAWLCFLGLSLGGLCLLMLHNLTGGAWGPTIRGAAESAALTLPAVIVLFIPVAWGMRDLYSWARPDDVAHDPALAHRQAYLNLPFFWTRTAIYFLLWLALLALLISWQNRLRATQDIRWYWRLRRLSAAGLILYLWTMTHAGIDWIMSRDVAFYSTTFGFIVTVGQTLGALSFALALMPRRPRPATPASRFAPWVLNDVGNILLTLVILWTYVSFMQLLVIWMGNTREDNTWYIQRGLGQPSPWRWFALALVAFHFFIPFYVLLFRASKQYLPALRAIAGLLLISFVAEQYWLISPSGHDEAPLWRGTWLDPLVFIAICGLWTALFLWIRARRGPAAELLPMPRFAPGVPAHD